MVLSLNFKLKTRTILWALRTECLTSGIERTIGSNEVRANLHELVPRPGLWERITIVGASNPVGVKSAVQLQTSIRVNRTPTLKSINITCKANNRPWKGQTTIAPSRLLSGEPGVTVCTGKAVQLQI